MKNLLVFLPLFIVVSCGTADGLLTAAPPSNDSGDDGNSDDSSHLASDGNNGSDSNDDNDDVGSPRDSSTPDDVTGTESGLDSSTTDDSGSGDSGNVRADSGVHRDGSTSDAGTCREKYDCCMTACAQHGDQCGNGLCSEKCGEELDKCESDCGR